MISIIVCSRNKALPVSFVKNVADSIKSEYEIILIDNSENQYSIFSAYNEGFKRSKFPYLCFVHEDVHFNTLNWGEKIINHLQQPLTGIIGLAGGDLVTRIPGACSGRMSSVNIIQSDKSGKEPTRKILFPLNYSESKRPVIYLDGVLLCMRRDVMKKLRFDASLEGFHGYDFDISILSKISGYINYVIYDIEMEHFSRGKKNALYYRNLSTVFKKWGNYLPLIDQSVSEERRAKIQNIEEKGLLKLTKGMIRNGFSFKETVEEITYFTALIDSEKANKRLNYIGLYVTLTRMFDNIRSIFS